MSVFVSSCLCEREGEDLPLRHKDARCICLGENIGEVRDYSLFRELEKEKEIRIADLLGNRRDIGGF